MTLLPKFSAPSRSFISSPLTTHLPRLSESQIASLPYPPNVFPGARDVKTAFGNMRVYEWGPETGRKVMLIHGDATSAPLWKGVATRLVKKGCRVIVLDLWGRGYSDTPVAAHEGRLYALQLLFAASSSSLPWCSEGFSVVGFSLGGAVTMEFVASFPHLVRSVALLAPVGLLKSLPKPYEELRQAAWDERSEVELRAKLFEVLGLDNADEAVVNDDQAVSSDQLTPVDPIALARWQFEHHEGHAASFISTLQYGPLQNQHAVWNEACLALTAIQSRSQRQDKLVVMCGSQDWVVPPELIRDNLEAMIGKKDVVFETMKGGHGFLLDDNVCEEVVAVLAREWQL